MDPLLECVPNVSEGRRPEVLQRLIEVSRVRGMRLVDHTSDVDHNRSVLTWIGRPQPLRRAATALAQAAVELIDLRQHQGVHPRVGALDVVPFIPLATTPMAVAVDTARATAEEITALTGVPTFLYERAASDPARRHLARHRRGGLAGLRRGMAGEDWPPDFGSTLHPTAGATMVAARRFLVAFNLVLSEPDLDAARTIARSIRQSTPGGLVGVKALGLLLSSQGSAQVSVNLTDHRRTSLLDLVQRVEREAASLGLGVLRSELVGLTPRAALRGAGAEALRLPELRPEHTVEHCLERFLSEGDTAGRSRQA